MEPIPIQQSTDPRRISEEGPILIAHQPEFFPWLGYIAKATMGDIYVLMDTVQYEKRNYQNRNRIRIHNPEGFQWINIPLKGIQDHYIPIYEVVIDGDQWKKKQLKSFQMSYAKAPFFKEIYGELENIYDRHHMMLTDFSVDIIRYAFEKFNITIPVYKISELRQMGYTVDGNKSTLMINMCKAVGAKTLIFGRDGRNYVEWDLFKSANIKPVFQDFHHPVYSQFHGEFNPYMSFIDLLFNHGPASIEILGKCGYTTE